MAGEKDLKILLKTLKPISNPGEFVFCVVHNLSIFQHDEPVMVFKEQEGNTVIVNKEVADGLKLNYSFVASWITLTVHSSLQAVGLTAAFSSALARAGISCNMVAGFYHDHIFVNRKDTERALGILNKIAD